MVPWKCARLVSQAFTSNDKLAEILIETSTSLVESTDSSMKDVCATRLCRIRRFSRLALEQSYKHLVNVLHQSLPVPQSNGMALFPASSTSSVSSSAWGLAMPRAFAPVQARDQHQIFSGYFPDCNSQNLPRSFKIESQSSEVSGMEPEISPAVFI